ncbi:substrate-binding domain-containing protein [Mucilaginibacter antarcticus]|uniref:substrate-binding domain-containing protein n=1 Tax=Mucilaginibacter antarcticus TaxID=1855725 RepID=UPI0036285F46
MFATDTLTINGLKYLNKLGVQVPSQLSVMSFDESEAFDLFYSPITHLRQPLEAMGQAAVNKLMEQIDHHKTNIEVKDATHCISELVVGRSCRE